MQKAFELAPAGWLTCLKPLRNKGRINAGIAPDLSDAEYDRLKLRNRQIEDCVCVLFFESPAGQPQRQGLGLRRR